MVIHLWNIIIKFCPKSLNDQREEDDDSLATRHIKLTRWTNGDRFTTTTDYSSQGASKRVFTSWIAIAPWVRPRTFNALSYVENECNFHGTLSWRVNVGKVENDTIYMELNDMDTEQTRKLQSILLLSFPHCPFWQALGGGYSLSKLVPKNVLEMNARKK